MKAIIPVAGIGTRLRPHTHTAPKVLLQVAGKPILAHILDELQSLGFTEITFIVGYKGQMIREFVTRNYEFKSNFVEQPEMKGLGHAISLAKDLHHQDEKVLIVLGDTIFKADLKRVLAMPQSAIGVRQVEDARRFGITELNPDGTILRLIEKPENPPTNLAIVGIYHITAPAMLFDCLDELIAEGRTTKGEFQLTDALQKMLDRSHPMRTFEISGWYDCGKAETLLETNHDLLNQAFENGTLNSSRVSGRIERSILIQPVAIAPSAVIENSIVGPHVSISANTAIRDAIIQNSIIGENAEVTSILLSDSIVSDNAKVQGNRYRLNVGDSSEIILD
jgi:glucose-1-phosphate thymidylyltransferase